MGKIISSDLSRRAARIGRASGRTASLQPSETTRIVALRDRHIARRNAVRFADLALAGCARDMFIYTNSLFRQSQ